VQAIESAYLKQPIERPTKVDQASPIVPPAVLSLDSTAPLHPD